MRELFEAAAKEGARIAATGARPVLLIPTRSADWPDLYDARREMGDAVTEREEEGLPETYLYSYAGVDFHRSGLAQPELFPIDLLELISIVAPDPSRPVEIAATPEGDPTDITLAARISVVAKWRDAEVVVLARRASRRHKCS